MLEQERLLPLLNDDRLTARVKLEDLLMVALEVRGCSQVLLPGEMPGGRDLMEQVDRHYSHKYFHGTDPDSGVLGSILDRAKYSLFRAVMHPLQYKATLIRETLDRLLLQSDNYRAHKEWTERLELDYYESHLRPSINEFYVYSRGNLAELQELTRLKKELREGKRRPDFGSTEMSAVVFPEQHSAEYVTRLGKLLGYPDCCIDRYIADHHAGLLPEVRVAEQLEDLQGGADESDEAFFARDFVPCSPDCEAARAIGRRTLEVFAETDRARLVPRYQGVLRTNREHLSRYPELLREHKRRMSGELADIREREAESDFHEE